MHRFDIKDLVGSMVKTGWGIKDLVGSMVKTGWGIKDLVGSSRPLSILDSDFQASFSVGTTCDNSRDSSAEIGTINISTVCSRSLVHFIFLPEDPPP